MITNPGVPNDQRLRVALDVFAPPAESRLRFGRQLGVEDVIVYGHTYTDTRQVVFQELLAMRQRVEGHGMRLCSIESFPARFYDKVMLGLEGRDEQLEELRRIVTHMGRAGVPMLGYNWMPSGVWRTTYSRPHRGGSTVTAFVAADAAPAPLTHDREYGELEMWRAYEYFLDALLPVAEEAGVVLAMHPNDPPVERLGGLPCLLRDEKSIQRALSYRDSPAHQAILCLGTWGAMDLDLFEVIPRLAAQDKIAYVHFQATDGTVPSFTESWVDLADDDAMDLIVAMKNAGIAVVMMPGHVPTIEGDTEWRSEDTPMADGFTQPSGRQLSPLGGHRARAYTIGYLRGILRAVYGPESHPHGRTCTK